VLNQTGEQIGQRPQSGFMASNQSLMALTQRLLRPVDAGERRGSLFRVNIADLSPRMAQLAAALVAAGLCTILWFAAHHSRAPGSAGGGAEEGMVLCLMVLLSPLAWTYFYCWMLLPWAAVVHATLALARRSGERRAAMAIGGCALGLSSIALTQTVDELPQALGATTLGAIVLYFLLARFRARSTDATECALEFGVHRRQVCPRPSAEHGGAAAH